MKTNVVELTAPSAEATSAARHEAHQRLRDYRTGTFATARQHLEDVFASANAASAEVQKLEDAVAADRARADAALLAADREGYRNAKLDFDFDTEQLATARQHAESAHAAYARAAEQFNSGPVAELKNLLASALMSEAPRIKVELDEALHAHIVPKLQLLAELESYFIRERIAGAGAEVLGGMRHQTERFLAAITKSAPGSAAKAELAALIETLNH